jgi:outer membrane protein assembly factor BamD (BamD/ComL family)
LDDYPGTEFDEECRFLWGESHYRDGDFAAAYGAYKSYATNFPVSPRGPVVEERLYDVGRDYLEGNQSAFFGIFSNRSKGLEILDYLVETFPSAERADDAKWLVARYHVDDENWEKAVPVFDFLTKQYKQSEWYPAARYFSAYCRYRRVKGDFYDPRMIEDARKGFAEYVAEHPNGEWRGQAETIIAELDATAAERMFKVGEWYVDQDKPYSARFYFLRVKQLWPGTDAARRAEAAYAEVALAEPETPEEELRLREEWEAKNAAAPAPVAPAAPESAPASRETK